MTTPKDEKRIRVTVKSQDAENIKFLCRELLLEARAHKEYDLKFYFWQQVCNIVKRKTAPILAIDPPLFVASQSRPGAMAPTEDPEQNISTGMAWAFTVFGIFCGVAASVVVFNL